MRLELTRAFVLIVVFQLVSIVSAQSLNQVEALHFDDQTRSTLAGADYFTILDGSVVLCRRSNGEIELSRYNVQGTTLVLESRSLLGQELTSLQTYKGGLVGFEPGFDTNNVLFMDQAFAEVRRLKIGLSVVTEIGVFANDHMIVYADSLYSNPVAESDVYADPEGAATAIIQSQYLEDHMVFLVDASFNVIAPLVRNYKGKRFLSRDFDANHVDFLRFPVSLRLNEQKSFAVVFNQHRDGLQIFTMQGQKFATITRPTGGMTPDPERFPFHVPEGEKVWYQSDVLLDGDLSFPSRPSFLTELFIYVADPPRKRIEVHKLTGINQVSFVGSFSTAQTVIGMAKGRTGMQTFLYFSDREGKLFRSAFPDPGDLAASFKQ